MKLLECVKIFDMNPPSFKISNSKKDIEDMLVGIPVVLHNIGSVEDDFELDNVIGYMDSIVPNVAKDEIYGNVFIFRNYIDLIGCFVNYHAYLDQDYNITKITAISIK